MHSIICLHSIKVMVCVNKKGGSTSGPDLIMHNGIQYVYVPKWLRCWTTDQKVVNLNPTTAKLPVLGH